MDRRRTGENESANTNTTNNNSDTAHDSGSSTFQFTFGVKSSQGSYIEAENSPDDIDSSESLSESVQNYPEEYGRTYHAYRAGSYAFPNDMPERERLALQHTIFNRLFNGKLFFAPLEKFPPRRILDIATGTGEWAIEMGDHFPNSHVTATDLSPIQPEVVPPNVTFFVEDSSEEWEYTIPFDYIHTRVTAGCWSSFRDQVAIQAFEALNPGGWFESQELDGDIHCDDGTLPPDSALAAWSADLLGASAALNRPLVMSADLKRIYEEVGFVDVHEKVFKIPMNGWAKDARLKEVGKMWEENMVQGLSGFSTLLFNRVFARSISEIEVSLIKVRQEMANPRIHAYMPFHVVWGRKPWPGEVSNV